MKERLRQITKIPSAKQVSDFQLRHWGRTERNYRDFHGTRDRGQTQETQRETALRQWSPHLISTPISAQVLQPNDNGFRTVAQLKKWKWAPQKQECLQTLLCSDTWKEMLDHGCSRTWYRWGGACAHVHVPLKVILSKVFIPPPSTLHLLTLLFSSGRASLCVPVWWQIYWHTATNSRILKFTSHETLGSH